MDWYHTRRARYRGEINWEAMMETEDRATALEVELRRVFDRRSEEWATL